MAMVFLSVRLPFALAFKHVTPHHSTPRHHRLHFVSYRFRTPQTKPRFSAQRAMSLRSVSRASLQFTAHRGTPDRATPRLHSNTLHPHQRTTLRVSASVHPSAQHNTSRHYSTTRQNTHATAEPRSASGQCAPQQGTSPRSGSLLDYLLVSPLAPAPLSFSSFFSAQGKTISGNSPSGKLTFFIAA